MFWTAEEVEEEIKHQRDLLGRYTKNLHHIETQIAMYDPGSVPAHLVNQRDDTEAEQARIREKIQELEQQLADQSTSVQGISAVVDSPLLGPSSGPYEKAVAYIQAHLPPNSEYINDVQLIMQYYWVYAEPVGVDPFLAAAQCVFETDSLRSYWAARPRRNPAGLGVHEGESLSFATWEDAVRAHLGQLLAFCLRDDEATPAQLEMMQHNPRHGKIEPELRGSVKKVGDLSGRWTADPAYGPHLVNRAREMMQ